MLKKGYMEERGLRTHWGREKGETNSAEGLLCAFI
jgi:hypothetical protein